MRGLSELCPLFFPAFRARISKFALSCIAVLAIMSSPAFGQKDTGAIAGVVKDPSGAAVTGAKITITDVDRGTTFNTTTNEQGEYVASPLKIGSYTVAVEKTGFKRQSLVPFLWMCRRVPRSTSLCGWAAFPKR